MIATTLRTVIFAACFACHPAASAAEETASAAHGNSSPEEKSAASEEFVALDMWVVTLRIPKDVVDEDRIGPLLEQTETMPTSIGTREDLRKLLDRWKDQGAIERQQTFRVSTRSGGRATFVSGARVATIVGTSISDLGQTNNIQYQQIGTAVNLTPTVEDEREIWVDVSYERSELEKSEDVALTQPAKGQKIAADNMPSLTVSTRARLNSGEAALIALTSDSAKKYAHLLILSAAIVGKPATDNTNDRP